MLFQLRLGNSIPLWWGKKIPKVDYSSGLRSLNFEIRYVQGSDSCKEGHCEVNSIRVSKLRESEQVDDTNMRLWGPSLGEMMFKFSGN